jgi:hypothetical protein
VVGFVHDNQVVTLALLPRATVAAQVIRIRAAQRLERDYLGDSASRCESIAPHWGQSRRDDDHAARILLRYRRCDVGLTHAHIVAEQRSTELIQGCPEASHRRDLVRLEGDGSDRCL